MPKQDIKEKIEQKVILTRLDSLIESNGKEHGEILKQVVKINSRVGKLEIWRGFITGGLLIISIFIVPILLYLVYSNFK